MSLEVAPGIFASTIFASTYHAQQQYYLSQASIYQKSARSAGINQQLDSENNSLNENVHAALSSSKKLEDEPVELAGDSSFQHHHNDDIVSDPQQIPATQLKLTTASLRVVMIILRSRHPQPLKAAPGLPMKVMVSSHRRPPSMATS